MNRLMNKIISSKENTVFYFQETLAILYQRKIQKDLNKINIRVRKTN